LGKQLVQSLVAVENDIVAEWGKVVAGEQDGVIRVVAKREVKLELQVLPPLVRTPSGPLTQPLSSSSLLAAARSNTGQGALGS
jgi:hypothetical protein